MSKLARSIAICLLAGAALIGTYLSPAGAHVGTTPAHLYDEHLFQMIKEDFFTRTAANNRFARATSLPVAEGSNANAVVNLDGTCQNVTSVTLDIPTNGRVIVTAKLQSSIAHTNAQSDEVYAVLTTDPADCDELPGTRAYHLVSSALPTAARLDENLVVLAEFEGLGVGSQTFYLNALSVAGTSAGDFVWWPAIVAEFFPN
jgi:hypothetical protein